MSMSKAPKDTAKIGINLLIKVSVLAQTVMEDQLDDCSLF